MNTVNFQKIKNEAEISHTENKAFYLLYKQAVLQELKEQGIIDECQLQLCLERLKC